MFNDNFEIEDKKSDVNNEKAGKTVTVLSYSDKNYLNNISPVTESTKSQSLLKPHQQAIDHTDDYYISNQLNDIVVSKSYELHYFVFHDDLEGVKKYIAKHKKLHRENLSDYLSIRDVHGNTPLHLAAMLGRIEISYLLTKYGAVVKARNKQMWTPLDEAVSYGNRDLIKCILKKYELEVDSIIETSKPKINTALAEMSDFYVEIKWDFESWIPLVSRFLPSDVCKLHKKGTKLRLDCTLGDLARSTVSANANSSSNGGNESSISPASVINWQRGDLSFIFDIEKIGEKKSLIYLDNKRKTFANIIDKQENEILIKDIDKEIDILLSRESIYVKLNTKQASFVPSQTGWFIKKDKIEQTNGYLCNYYDVSNLFIVSKLRSEHLSEDEIKKNEELQKKLRQQLMKGGNLTDSSSKIETNDDNSNEQKHADDIDDLNLYNGDIEFRPNLPPPEKAKVTWNEYINSPEGTWPHLGRKQRNKESKKEFKAQLAMSQEFPLTLNDLNKLLDALAPLAKFRKLKEFVNQKLPPGFPVKIDIPIVPTVSAKVSFQNFKRDIEFNDSLFKVPEDYTEENIFEKMKADSGSRNKGGSSSSLSTKL